MGLALDHSVYACPGGGHNPHLHPNSSYGYEASLDPAIQPQIAVFSGV